MSAQRTLSITRLYEDHIEKLKLSWIAAIGIERLVALGDQEVYGPDIVGHLNLIYSHRVQVIGKAEMLWAERVGSERWRRQIEDIMASRPPALIVADGLEVPADTLELCEATQTPLFTSPKPCSAVTDGGVLSRAEIIGIRLTATSHEASSEMVMVIATWPR